MELAALYSAIPLFFFLFLLSKWLSGTSKGRDELPQPPSPPRLPIIGNLHQLGLFPHRSIYALAQKYGPVMLLHFGSKPVLVVSTAEAAREIFKTHDVIFSSRPKLSNVDKIFYAKDMTFVPYGEHWRQVRSIAVLHLLSNRRVKTFRRVREEETAIMMEKIGEACSSPSSTVNVSKLFVSVTNDVVCRIAVGRKHGGDRFKAVLLELTESLGVFDVGDYIPWLSWVSRLNGLKARVAKVAEELDQLMEAIVEEHLERHNREGNVTVSSVEQESKQDFVDVLLGIQRDKTLGFTLERDTIKALILDMFVAGTETTYTSLNWTIAELIRHPKVMKKLQNEVREIINSDRIINEDDIERLPYLRAVIKESMRLHPPGPMLLPRASTQDVNVLGYKVAAGTQVFIHAWAIQHDPNVWQDPDEFQPERFLNSSIDFKGQDFELIPFGAGRRICPGVLFTTTIYELVLANMVNKFNFCLPGGVRGEDLDMTESPGVAVQIKHPICLVATKYYGEKLRA